MLRLSRIGWWQVRRLKLATESYDPSPRRFSCPDPPKCTLMESQDDLDGEPLPPAPLLP